jgi:hypothetical protein
MQTEKNMQFDEQVAVTRRLKNSDQTTAKVILDLSKKSVVRNGWGSTEQFDELFKYFHASYPKYTTEVMAMLDPVYLERINAEMAPPEPETPIAEPTSSGSSITSAV